MLASIIFAATLSFLLGLAFCFLGYRVFLVLLPIWGFFAGFWLGAQAIALLLGSGFLATTTSFAVGFAVGLVFAVLSYLFFVVGVAIVAGAIGAALGTGLMAALGFDTGLLVTLVGLVSAIVVAVVTLWFNIQKYVIIVATALAGANLIVLSPLLLFGQVTLDELEAAGSSIGPILRDSWFWLIIWMALAVFGVVVQIRANREWEFTADRYVEGWE